MVASPLRQSMRWWLQEFLDFWTVDIPPHGCRFVETCNYTYRTMLLEYSTLCSTLGLTYFQLQAAFDAQDLAYSFYQTRQQRLDKDLESNLEEVPT